MTKEELSKLIEKIESGVITTEEKNKLLKELNLSIEEVNKLLEDLIAKKKEKIKEELLKTI